MEHFTLAQNLQTNQKTNAGFKSTSLAEDTHKTRLHKKNRYVHQMKSSISWRLLVDAPVRLVD